MSTPPNTLPNNPSETTPTASTPPQDFGNIEFNATNLITQGATNQIINSRRSSVLNGTLNTISGFYNTHIIGDFVTAQEDNKFYVGCPNGMWVGGKIDGSLFGEIHCDSNILAQGDITAEGDITAANLSDKRLKNDISLIENPLLKIISLDAIEFNWNDKQSTHQGHDIGLIAQQVEKIAPEIVKERSNGYKALKYEKVIPLLVGAIKEQEEKIQILNDRVEYLLRKVDSMS
jgi:hypothetical protein